MARKTYRFRFYDFGGGLPRPSLHVRFINPLSGKKFQWQCLIDTGASQSILPSTVTNLTDHNLRGPGVKNSVTCGIENKNVTTWLHTFIIELLHPQNPNLVIWKSRKRKYHCVEHARFQPLLGQSDFLRFFKVTIDYRKQITTLEWSS